MSEEIKIIFDEESETWTEKKEPYISVEFETEEEYNIFLKMVKFWKENHNEEERED